MRTRLIAAVELMLLAPAVAFMTALFVRNLNPLEVAHTAERLVMWYAGRMWTLWVLLLALPLTVLVTGWPHCDTRGNVMLNRRDNRSP